MKRSGVPALVMAGVMLASTGLAGVPEVEDLTSIAPGTRGTCVTDVGRGELLEFPVTVLGMQGGAAPEGELVLVRLEDPFFEKAGVIAGMSGSPVYVDGKLLGAVAFGWGFSTEPIAGVTPFRRMVDLAAAPAPGRVGIGRIAGPRPPFPGRGRPSFVPPCAEARSGTCRFARCRAGRSILQGETGHVFDTR